MERPYISRIQRRMFFLAFVTAFVSTFTQTLAVLIDNIIVCIFFGENEIAAVTLAGPFFYALEMPAAGLAAGILAVCARDLGAGNIERANLRFNQVFSFTAPVLVILTLLSFALVPQMAVLFGARGKTAVLQPSAAQYLYGLSFEIVPYVLFCITAPVVVLDNGGRLVSIASAFGCVTDIVLDLLSVRFGWGLFGIGVASSASALVYFLITMIHFVKREHVFKLHFVRIRFHELKEVFISAMPKAIHSLADTIRSFIFISLVSMTGGVVGTCVLSIHGTISYTVMILAKAIAGAVGIMAGICWGEKNGDELEGNSRLSFRYVLVLSVVAISVLTGLARPIANALTQTDATADLLTFAIYCICIGLPFTILVQVRISYLQAVGHIREAQWVGVAANLIILSVAAVLYAIPFGVRGVFVAFPTSQVLTLLFICLLHYRRNGKVFPSLKDYLEVDDSFYKNPGDIISYPVETNLDCSLASEQVQLFCRGHRLDAGKGMLASLCVEELTVNAIKYRTKTRQEIKTADIRVVIDGDTVIIRLRDSGTAFNLKHLSDRLAEEDRGTAEAGLKLLLHSATSVSHYRTYGMNTTIIKV